MLIHISIPNLFLYDVIIKLSFHVNRIPVHDLVIKKNDIWNTKYFPEVGWSDKFWDQDMAILFVYP